MGASPLSSPTMSLNAWLTARNTARSSKARSSRSITCRRSWHLAPTESWTCSWRSAGVVDSEQVSRMVTMFEVAWRSTSRKTQGAWGEQHRPRYPADLARTAAEIGSRWALCSTFLRSGLAPHAFAGHGLRTPPGCAAAGSRWTQGGRPCHPGPTPVGPQRAPGPSFETAARSPGDRVPSGGRLRAHSSIARGRGGSGADAQGCGHPSGPLLGCGPQRPGAGARRHGASASAWTLEPLQVARGERAEPRRSAGREAAMTGRQALAAAHPRPHLRPHAPPPGAVAPHALRCAHAASRGHRPPRSPEDLGVPNGTG